MRFKPVRAAFGLPPASAERQDPVGFINPALYTASLSSSATTACHDITSGSNPSDEYSTQYPEWDYNAVTIAHTLTIPVTLEKRRL